MIYRSPKWLRNIIDFEISTGEDIKGVPSKRRQKKIKAAEELKRKEELSKKWNSKWNAMRANDYLEDKFKDFYKKMYGWNRSFIFSSDFDTIKERWENDMQIWVDFTKYIKEEKKKEAEHERIKKELDDLASDIMNDYVRNRYSDKVSTERNSYGKIKVKFRFEDGRTVTMQGDTIILESRKGTNTFTVGLLYQAKFSNVFSQLINDINAGNSKRRSKSRSSYNKGYASGKKRKTYDHPKRGLYETLLETIAQREDQLKGMSNYDENRESLQNELDNAKRQAEKIKVKYKF
ncbi:MAG: hypothetical protein SLAVMIC_00022 [uncultured marine phage]|uniref:Uncharacterized protein n=1 Tax=uncultured marine phage TaxID=707152 RepID=A0A8D9FQE5_9VIRU|nr:MAG: hypothetical protein SLAVMIC_00022 [uncultured marine phage]